MSSCSKEKLHVLPAIGQAARETDAACHNCFSTRLKEIRVDRNRKDSSRGVASGQEGERLSGVFTNRQNRSRVENSFFQCPYDWGVQAYI